MNGIDERKENMFCGAKCIIGKLKNSHSCAASHNCLVKFKFKLLSLRFYFLEI